MTVELKRNGFQQGCGGRYRLAATCRSVLLAPVLLAASALNSSAWALGLGDIDVHSALNQPLDAQVDLLSVRSEDVARINVRLADDVAYLTSGVERTPLLNQLIFAVEQSPSGKTVVKVSTREPVKEPFLDFIIEVNWPSGRLLREYTVLLDPPTFVGEAQAAVSAPQQQSTSPIAPFGADFDAPARTSRATTESRTRSSGGMTATVSDADSARHVAGGDGSYGPVAPGESLRSIAEKTRPDSSVSAQQMMMALFEANPDAFVDDNINNLKAGHVLRLPDEAKIAQLSKTEAGRMAREHYNRWLQNRRTKAATSTEKVSSTAGLAAMSDGSKNAPAQTSSESQLRLFSPDARDAAGLGGDGGKGAGNDELANVEAKELRHQVAQLKDQLATMERLISLKDDALVQMQRKMTGDPGTPPASAEIPAPVSTPDQAATVSPVPAMEATASGDVAPAKAEEIAKEDAATTPEEQAPPPPQVKKGRASQETPPETEGEGLSSLLLQPRVLAMLVGVLLLVGAVVWTMVRRRRAALEEEYAMSMPEEGGDFHIPSSTELAARGFENAGTSGAETLDFHMPADETADIGADNLETLETNESDIDPIAEADVYLAYRRFQQAEALIKDALEREPDRTDLQLKLLEIYFGSGNKTAFEALGEALYAQVGGGDAEVWPKVLEMGQELCPDHPLFGAGGTQAAGGSLDETVSPVMAAMQPSAAAPLFESNPFAASSAADELAPTWDQPAGDDEHAPEDQAADDVANLLDFSAKAGAPSDDFNLNFNTDAEVPDADSDSLFGAKDVGAGSGDGGMDFDLSGFNFEKPASIGGPKSPSNVTSFDEHVAAGKSARNQADLDLDSALSAMSDSGSSAVEEIFTGLDDADLGGDSGDLFAGADMIGTKLDLARAYIDMDDRDGARGILKEVIEEGSETQRQEANELMRKLGS